MQELGVKTIVYSSKDGSIVKQKLNEYIPTTISSGKRFMLRQYAQKKTLGREYIPPIDYYLKNFDIWQP